MKKILFFSWQHLWSMKSGAGAPSYHHTIMHYINSPLWDVYIFSVDKTNESLEIAKNGKVFIYSASEWVDKGFTKKKINNIFKRIKMKDYTKWAVSKASEVLSDEDDAYAYGYEVWGVKAAQAISKKYRIPLITRFQGTVLCDYENTLYNRIRWYPHFEALSTRADLVIMTDDGTFGDDVVKKLGNMSRCLFIRNGLDLYSRYDDILRNTDSDEVKKELGIERNTKVLMMCSRLASWKRVDRGITALSEIVKHRQDIHLVIAGDGDMREELESLSRELHVDKYVTFLGAVEHKDLYRYLLSADIFLSLYDIGNLGNPTFEAMMLRRAIIALNNGATYTVLHDGENSLLCDVDKIYKLPNMIMDILDNDEKREYLAEGALTFAKNNFYTWEERLKREERMLLNIDRTEIIANSEK